MFPWVDVASNSIQAGSNPVIRTFSETNNKTDRGVYEVDPVHIACLERLLHRRHNPRSSPHFPTKSTCTPPPVTIFFSFPCFLRADGFIFGYRPLHLRSALP